MISVKDPPFGAVGDGRTDDYLAFAAALAHLRAQPFNAAGAYQGAQRLYIPAGDYLLSQTLDIKGMSLIIEGESCGEAGGYATVLQWPACTTGIRIQRYNTIGTAKELPATKGADATILRNLALYGGGGTGDFHGIHGRARFVAEDVVVRGFAHSGIFIHATSGGSDNSEGNANCFALSRIRTIGNGVAGLWVQGADANAGAATHVNSSGNGQYGIYDSSFLGNTYVGCHTRSNGQRNTQVSHKCSRYHVVYGQAVSASTTEPGTNPAVWSLTSAGGVDAGCPLWVSGATYVDGGAVSHNCNRYRVVSGQAVSASTTEPGTNPAVWTLTSAGGVDADHPLWVSGATYLDGGAYVSVSNNAASVFVGCYSEKDQPASYASWPALFIGGIDGAGTYGTASVLAGRLTGLEVSPGLFTSGAHGASTIRTTVGGSPANGDFLRFTHSTGGPSHWRLKVDDCDIVWPYANADANVAYGITGPNTALKFGRATTLPHAFYAAKLIIGGGTNAARRVTCLPAAPITGDWAKGDFCFHSAPAANGVLGWSCTTSGTPGTWTPVRIMAQVAAQADSVAPDIAALVADFNGILAKMRTAGILAQ
jgi:hypothetical protein